jgi:hypothetical protein
VRWWDGLRGGPELASGGVHLLHSLALLRHHRLLHLLLLLLHHRLHLEELLLCLNTQQSLIC